MALNPHFLQGSRGEQRLIQSLINEQLKIYGVEVTFIPRKFVNQSTIIEEVTASKFDDNFLIEAYDCFRALDPEEYRQVYNDPFVKRYFVALMKKQWGMNLIKFRGTKLPGGIELNGREIYDDGVREIEELRSRMMQDYETPPLDFIG